MRAEEVDPRLIVSGTYNDYEPCDPAQVMDWSDSMANDGDKFESEAPRIARIGRLPLFVALEGKNRVELFKRFRRRMRVLVTDTPFPEPEDLQLVPIRPWALTGLQWGDCVEVLPFSAAVVPLLRVYGVSDGKPVFSLAARRDHQEARAAVLRSRMLR